MTRLKVTRISVEDEKLCSRCSEALYNDDVAITAGLDEGGFVNIIYSHKYSYVMLDGKKYRFELVEVE